MEVSASHPQNMQVSTPTNMCYQAFCFHDQLFSITAPNSEYIYTGGDCPHTLQMEVSAPLKHLLRGIYTDADKRAEHPRESRPRAPQWIGLYKLCDAIYTAAGPLSLCSGPAAGARRDRSRSDSYAGSAAIGSADWSVFIDQRPSATKWGFGKVKLGANPR